MAFMSMAAYRMEAPTWMELIMDSPALWERVVKYGQFQPIDPEETEQMMRQRRKNTFPKTVPKDILNGHGGRIGVHLYVAYVMMYSIEKCE